MVRVLQVGMTRNWGGLETYLMQQFRHLDPARVHYDFANITGEYDICFQQEIRDAGSNVYDVSITSYGDVSVTNNSWWYGLLALIFVSVITVFAGVFILPVYWLYFAVCTVILAVRLFRR